jgi:hypothetical protein
LLRVRSIPWHFPKIEHYLQFLCRCWNFNAEIKVSHQGRQKLLLELHQSLLDVTSNRRKRDCRTLSSGIIVFREHYKVSFFFFGICTAIFIDIGRLISSAAAPSVSLARALATHLAIST